LKPSHSYVKKEELPPVNQRGVSVRKSYVDRHELPFKKRMQNLLDAKLNGEKIVFEKLVSLEKNLVLA
jgi:hypothetical protein